MPWSGCCQTLRRALGLRLHDRPEPPRQPVALARVLEDRVEHGAEDVVLLLVEGAVADPHRLRARVAGHVVAGRLGQVAAAVDAVHDLERPVVGRLDVGDELHELVGLPVEVEPVQRVERERRVAHPGVAVVPVALAARRLRQRRREGRDRRTGRHVGEALDRERRALHGSRKRWSGMRARPSQPRQKRQVASSRVGRLLDGRRRLEALRPRQRAEGLLAGLEHMAAADAVALDAEPEVGHEPDASARRRSPARRARRRRRASRSRARARSRTRARRSSSTSTLPSMHSTVRTSMWSPSSSAGGRVCGVTVSRRRRGPMVSASRTTTQPFGTFHVVSSTFVPGS